MSQIQSVVLSQRYVATLRDNYDSEEMVPQAQSQIINQQQLLSLQNQNLNPQQISTKTQNEIEEEEIVEEEEVQPIIVQPNVRINHVNKKSVLGEGSFGCVFTPAFPCEGHAIAEYDGLVSKVTTENEAKKELEISQLLKSIDF